MRMSKPGVGFRRAAGSLNLIAPDPILATHPLAWFRADTYFAGGPGATALRGRVGTEGNISLTGGSGIVTASNPLANNQPSMGIAADSDNYNTKSASFWGPLYASELTWWLVFVSSLSGSAQSIVRAGSDFRVLNDPTLFTQNYEWGPGGDNVLLSIAPPFPSELCVTKALGPDAGADISVAADGPVTGYRGNNGYWTTPPPGAVDGTLQLGDAETPAFEFCEFLVYDRTLTPGSPDADLVSAYLFNRYGFYL